MERGRVWTLLTANFAHQDLLHFGLNMFVLHSFAETVAVTLGAARFAAFYAASGVFTTAFHLAYTRFVAPEVSPYSRGRFYDVPSLGASGCVMATMGRSVLGGRACLCIKII